jgi:hypothetical protein
LLPHASSEATPAAVGFAGNAPAVLRQTASPTAMEGKAEGLGARMQGGGGVEAPGDEAGMLNLQQPYQKGVYTKGARPRVNLTNIYTREQDHGLT